MSKTCRASGREKLMFNLLNLMGSFFTLCLTVEIPALCCERHNSRAWRWEPTHYTLVTRTLMEKDKHSSLTYKESIQADLLITQEAIVTIYESSSLYWFGMWTKVQFLGCGRCVAARSVVASCDIELPSQNEQSHPSRNVLAGHPKQLTFSWTTEKKEESPRSPKTLPNYDCVCTYACIFPINREKSHLALFSTTLQ